MYHFFIYYNDVIMSAMASQITSLTLVYSSVYSGVDQSKHQSSALLAFVRGIHRRPVNSPHKGPVTRKMFPFDDVIMLWNRMLFGPVCIFWSVLLLTSPPQMSMLPRSVIIFLYNNLLNMNIYFHYALSNYNEAVLTHLFLFIFCFILYLFFPSL